MKNRIIKLLEKAGIGIRVFGRIQRNSKDKLFRMIFGRNKKALLELYNALNGTSYDNAEELRIVTLDNAVYVTMKNDVAFIISGVISLYEHQSTLNANMPARMLIYLAKEYQFLIETNSRSVYGKSLIKLPTPQCVMLYNGEEELPDEAQLKLSDAFENKDVKSSVELVVRVVNINAGRNEAILKGCRLLNEYAQFVDTCRNYVRKMGAGSEAYNKAIDYCIEHDILREVLEKSRAEVLGIMFTKFDRKKYERTLREEAYDDGRQDGIEQSQYDFYNRCIKSGMSKEEAMELSGATKELLDRMEAAIK